MVPVCVEHAAPVAVHPCAQRRRLARAGLLVAAVAAGTAALSATGFAASASAAEPVVPSAAVVVLPGPVGPGRAPLTVSAREARRTAAAHPGRRNPFGAPVAPSRTASAPDAPMTLEEAVRIAPPAPPVSRSGRNPFLALVAAEAAAGTARPSDLPATSGDRVLALGASGEDVRDLQTRLAATGADVTADGSYGPRTVVAVSAFQSRRRLTVDGITGPQTWAALRSQ